MFGRKNEDIPGEIRKILEKSIKEELEELPDLLKAVQDPKEKLDILITMLMSGLQQSQSTHPVQQQLLKLEIL